VKPTAASAALRLAPSVPESLFLLMARTVAGFWLELAVTGAVAAGLFKAGADHILGPATEGVVVITAAVQRC
jgi:hypothetical protein